MAYIRYRPRTEVIDVLLSFNFAVVFNFNVFRFRPSKPQFLGDFSMNKKKAAKKIVRPCCKYFMFFCVIEVDWSCRVLPIHEDITY